MLRKIKRNNPIAVRAGRSVLQSTCVSPVFFSSNFRLGLFLKLLVAGWGSFVQLYTFSVKTYFLRSRLVLYFYYILTYVGRNSKVRWHRVFTKKQIQRRFNVKILR